MWNTKLIDKKLELGYSNKDIELGTGISESTIARIFSKKEKDIKRGHSASTIKPIANFLGLTLDELFEDTNAFVGGKTFVEMQGKIESLLAERERFKADINDLNNEILSLKELLRECTSKIEVLKTTIHFQEELLAVHNLYIKHLKD